MKKHKFNIFPELSSDEYNSALNDIKCNGYDSSLPIVTYQGDIIDGWNRQRICDELGVTPAYKAFDGSDAEAIDYIMRTNKRRSLKPGQWACLAAEAEDLMALIRADVEKGRREKQAENAANQYSEPSGNKLPEPSTDNSTSTDTKVAKLFNTNRTYVNQAVKLKKENPEEFEKVKSGQISMPRTSNKEKPKTECDDMETVVVDGIKNATTPKNANFIESNGMGIFYVAKSHMEKIAQNDTDRVKALESMVKYCQSRISQNK